MLTSAALAAGALAACIPLHAADAQRKPKLPPTKPSVAAAQIYQPPAKADTVLSFGAPGCGLTAYLTRTRVVTAIAAIATFPMPDFTRTPVSVAEDSLRRHFIAWRVGRMRSRNPFDTILSQAPNPGTRLLRGDTVVLCWRVREAWPPVVGLQFATAARVLTDSAYVPFRRDTTGAPDSSVGLVVAQQPPAGAPADSGGVDTLFVAVAASTIAARPDSVLVPDLLRQPAASAADTLMKLGLRVSTRMVNRSRVLPGQLIVDSQLPPGGTRLAPGTTVLLVLAALPGRRPLPWGLIIAALVLLAAGVTAARGRWHLNAIQTVPRTDSGTQHLMIVSEAREGDRSPHAGNERRAGEELANRGFSVAAVADPGAQSLHIPQTPPRRDESDDA